MAGVRPPTAAPALSVGGPHFLGSAMFFELFFLVLGSVCAALGCWAMSHA